MENFKKTIWPTALISIFMLGCDPVYKLRTEPLPWKIKNPPTEVLRITGTSYAFPTLDTIILTRNQSEESLKLILMTNTTLPDSALLNQLYARPLDSLSKQKYVFDTLENAFYPLCVAEFSPGQRQLKCILSRPITYKHLYVFGLANQTNIEVSTAFHFHRLGKNEIPLVEVVPIE